MKSTKESDKDVHLLLQRPQRVPFVHTRFRRRCGQLEPSRALVRPHSLAGAFGGRGGGSDRGGGRSRGRSRGRRRRKDLTDQDLRGGGREDGHRGSKGRAEKSWVDRDIAGKGRSCKSRGARNATTCGGGRESGRGNRN
jgi:hypothetical protein